MMSLFIFVTKAHYSGLPTHYGTIGYHVSLGTKSDSPWTEFKLKDNDDIFFNKSFISTENGSKYEYNVRGIAMEYLQQKLSAYYSSSLAKIKDLYDSSANFTIRISANLNYNKDYFTKEGNYMEQRGIIPNGYDQFVAAGKKACVKEGPIFYFTCPLCHCSRAMATKGKIFHLYHICCPNPQCNRNYDEKIEDIYKCG